MNSSELSYCGEDIKNNDYDRYLTCLFTSDQCREHLFALYAFNQEIAKTAEVVSEPLTGMIRLQWWREAIEGIYSGTPRKHHVVEALALAISDHGLPREKFDALINAREMDLEDEIPQNVSTLETYLSKTSSALLGLALDITCPENTETQYKASHSMGLAWGILGVIRATPFYAAKKRIFIPQDLIDETGLKKNSLLELQSSSELCEAMKTLVKRAQAHLIQARSFSKELPKIAIPPLLLGVLADQYIKLLEDNGFNPFDSQLHKPSSLMTWKLMWANMLSRY